MDRYSPRARGAGSTPTEYIQEHRQVYDKTLFISTRAAVSVYRPDSDVGGESIFYSILYMGLVFTF